MSAVAAEKITVYGDGKMIRAFTHVRDVVEGIVLATRKGRSGEVYNIGGGRANSCSILEAARLVEELGGGQLRTEYVDEPRRGDHICYISDLRKLKDHYPGWDVDISLRAILAQNIEAWKTRRGRAIG